MAPNSHPFLIKTAAFSELLTYQLDWNKGYKKEGKEENFYLMQLNARKSHFQQQGFTTQNPIVSLYKAKVFCKKAKINIGT